MAYRDHSGVEGASGRRQDLEGSPVTRLGGGPVPTLEEELRQGEMTLADGRMQRLKEGLAQGQRVSQRFFGLLEEALFRQDRPELAKSRGPPGVAGARVGLKHPSAHDPGVLQGATNE